MKPEVKVFSRDEPCTKLNIWNAFKGVRGWKRVQVDVAHSIVGLNAPKNMLSNSYIEKGVKGAEEYYYLTEIGKEWLTIKFRNYLLTHPDKRKLALNLPKSF